MCTYEMTEFASVLDGNGRFAVFLHNFEGPVLYVMDDIWVVHLTANETVFSGLEWKAFLAELLTLAGNEV
jgi:hypothetical protein